MFLILVVDSGERAEPPRRPTNCSRIIQHKYETIIGAVVVVVVFIIISKLTTVLLLGHKKNFLGYWEDT
jgi:hypothetical protein